MIELQDERTDILSGWSNIDNNNSNDIPLGSRVLEINVNHSRDFPTYINIGKDESEPITYESGGGFLDYDSFRVAEALNCAKDKAS